ncbi:MAG: MAPEG family protein [Myxococcota bacterium]
MSLPITTTVLATLALLLVVLSIVTMVQRVRHDQPWGDGDIPELRRAVRAQGNLVEYAPVLLLALAALELRGASVTLLAALGASFVLARVAYVAYAFVTGHLALRILGFWGSVGPIAIASVWLLLGVAQ